MLTNTYMLEQQHYNLLLHYNYRVLPEVIMDLEIEIRKQEYWKAMELGKGQGKL